MEFSRVLKLPDNRVRRNYLGGKHLDLMQGVEPARDGNCPEDWIASTVEARNPGLETVEFEGLARVELQGENQSLLELFQKAPEYYLGSKHLEVLGHNLGFLAKLLDSSMRLHLQAHPTAAYAQKHLNSRWGKLETYVILSVRPEAEGYIWLGFQNSPSPEEWKRIVLEQDLPAMHACFENVKVNPGEVWVVPGGIPHAIGEGVLVLEVMEPTDLVVRCEFEREGIVVPPEARFMGREPEKALEIFEFKQESQDEIRERCRINSTTLLEQEFLKEELLIGPEQTDCFTIKKWTVTGREKICIQKNNLILVGIVSRGKGLLKVVDKEIKFKEGDKFLIPAAESEILIHTDGEDGAEILVCQPGYGMEEKS